MTRGIDVLRRACAPCGEQPQRVRKLPSGPRELVTVTNRSSRVRNSDEQTVPFETLQPLRQDVGRDARHPLDQIVEATRPAQKLFDQEQGPAIADESEGFVERGSLGRDGGGFHRHTEMITCRLQVTSVLVGRPARGRKGGS